MNNWDLYRFTHKNNGGAVQKDIRFKEVVEKTITSVDDDDIVTVGRNAFIGCDKMTTAVLPNATTIGIRAFYECLSW